MHVHMHDTIQTFVGDLEVRKRTLLDEFNSATKSMANSGSEDWKGYIVDNVGQADQPTSLYSMGAKMRTGINSLKDGHKNLTKFRTHVQGIDHTTAKKSRRLVKNKDAKDRFGESLQPTRQHGRTIVDAVERRAEVEQLLATSAAKLINNRSGSGQRSSQPFEPLREEG